VLSEIYFINTRELAKKLACDEISDRVAFLHFLVHAIIISAAISKQIDMRWAGNEPDSWLNTIISFIALGAVQYWGFTAAYKLNLSIDGKDFFLRYAALSLPLSIQFIVLGFLASLAYGAVVGVMAANFSNSGIPTEVWYAVGVVFTAAVSALYFKLLFIALQQLKEYKASASSN